MNKAKFFLISFVVFFFLSGVANAQNNSLPSPGLTPESSFYFFDKFGEWARFNFFTFSPIAKAKLKIKYAEERLAELERVSGKKDVSLKVINEAKERFEKFSKEAASGAEKLKKEGKKIPADIAEKLNNLAQRQESVLQKVLEQVPDEAKPAIRKVLESSRERFVERTEKKTEEIKEEKMEVKSEIKPKVKPETPKKIEIETPEIKVKTVPLSKVREINIANGGFEPSKIEVEKGMIVRWFNRSDRESWPASNIHPAHTLYPEKGGCIGSKFDACRGIKPGEAYEFVFEKEGTWGYHDHLKPGSQGVIIVK